ncbi:DUF1120 domain-containing protein [Pseudomonas khavaziana]|uniref:DUF1120 domain-containing protein n=1 Tax=Pseudomonas khavaziana TaxID=2842351 RepID=UPI001C3C2C9D|nr:DUF1120 domain-containing protein [Pseudomonas khavaziana]MBV4479500.1 DUF1120 domain-containing protein [Pseudomonas khavaziana]
MKKIVGLTVGLVCLAATLGVKANTGSSANLKVVGTIKPAACTVHLGATGGEINYGQIRASDIPPNAYYPLDEKTLPLTVNCGSTAAQMALSVTDLQSSSTVAGILGFGFAESQNFGLGLVGGKRTGGYSVRLSRLASQGANLYPIKRASASGAWLYSSSGLVDKYPYQHSWSRSTAATPAFVNSITGTLAVKAVLNRGSELNLSNDIPLNGLATLIVTRI